MYSCVECASKSSATHGAHAGRQAQKHACPSLDAEGKKEEMVYVRRKDRNERSYTRLHSGKDDITYQALKCHPRCEVTVEIKS